MAVANIDIKGNPKDFLAALDKSKKRIKEVRKEAEDMNKGGSKMVAGAAAVGGALGGAMGQAAIAAIKFAFAKSKLAKTLLGGIEAGDAGLAFSNEMDALQDRAARLGMRGQEADLFAGEVVAGTIGGLGSEKYNQMLQKTDMKRQELTIADGQTDFGLLLDKLQMVATSDLNSQDFMLTMLEKMEALNPADQLAGLKAAGFEVETIGAARQLILDAKQIRDNLLYDLNFLGGGREVMNAKIAKAAGAAGLQESNMTFERYNMLDRASENQDVLKGLAQTQHEQTVAMQDSMATTAKAIEAVQSSLGQAIDWLGNAGMTQFKQLADGVSFLAEKAKIFDGQPRPKE